MPPAEQITARVKMLHVNTVIANGALAIPHPQNYRRNYFAIYNTGSNIGYLRFGQPCKATATMANGDIPVPAGQSIVYVSQVPVDSINLSAPNGATTFSTVEGLPTDPQLTGKLNG
jgi:hypothetical protein